MKKKRLKFWDLSKNRDPVEPAVILISNAIKTIRSPLSRLTEDEGLLLESYGIPLGSFLPKLLEQIDNPDTQTVFPVLFKAEIGWVSAQWGLTKLTPKLRNFWQSHSEEVRRSHVFFYVPPLDRFGPGVFSRKLGAGAMSAISKLDYSPLTKLAPQNQ